MFRKIPQASESTSPSCPAKTTAISTSSSLFSHHSKQRTGNLSASSHKTSARDSSSMHGSFNSSSRSSGHSDKSGGSQTALHIKPSLSVMQPGPGRPKNPVGRPSKQQQPRLREPERADTLSKRKADVVSPERNSASPDRDKDRARPPGSGKITSAQISTTVTPSSHGQTNGSLSPGHKQSRTEPWAFKRTHTPGQILPLEPGSSGRAGNSGHHGGRPPGHEHKGGLSKKRKSSESSPPSKAHRLSTSPHSGFYPWKESKGAPLPVGGEKKLSVPKVSSNANMGF